MSTVVVNCLTTQKQNSSQRQLRAKLLLDNVQFLNFLFLQFSQTSRFYSQLVIYKRDVDVMLSESVSVK